MTFAYSFRKCCTSFLDDYDADITDEDIDDADVGSKLNQFVCHATSQKFKTFSQFHEAAVDLYLEQYLP